MDEVPYPPPAARVETVPPRKNAGDVWIDGQWDWDGTAWKWLEGSWTTPPAGAYFTPWATERRGDGRLFFARATWRTRDGRSLDVGPGRDACPLSPAPAAAPVAKR
jgi:WXXGXW repeat (2 copies)